MINLIPPVVRKAIVTEYWIRVVSVWFFIASVVNIVVILFALPVYVLVSSQVESFAQAATEAEKRVADYDLSAGALIKANISAQKIFELRDVEHFSDAVSQIESLRSQGISLEGFVFGRKQGSIAPIQLTGEAENRQVLSDFRDKLLSQPNVSEVILPISNLAKDKDIRFSMSIIFKEKS